MGRPQTTKDFPRISLRLPPELYNELTEEATKNFRSINNEIMLRLIKTLKPTPGVKELEKL